jgi:hypothetical protein
MADRNAYRKSWRSGWLAQNVPPGLGRVCRKVKKLIANEMVKYEDSTHLTKGTIMKTVSSTPKLLLVAAAVLSLTFAGCDRRASDQTSGGGSAGTSSSSGGSGSMGSSGSSGGSGTSGSSGMSGGSGGSGTSGSSGSGTSGGSSSGTSK